ncbi:BlaI/MecI/CopY family transcriptional regulator [Desertivirga brevis]|uniref:BlaI/MecI/CopY family transcriptional regulator n=1 Tax=Desertivirga brevis TaxID=2810310 RepID=UPI001A965CEA|nr:BlaI/MecI/CopY family transcriptional regulator [Pedobacter sp. SYSU D00873]
MKDKSKNSIKELTKAEEQVMRILWRLKEGIVKNIIEEMPEPKPAYNTVSTVIRVLETKGFVNHKVYGSSHIYYPLIAEKDYKTFAFDKIFSNYFNNSYKHLLSFLVDEKEISEDEIKELTQLVEKLKKR